MRRFLGFIVLLALVGAGVGWVLTAPTADDASAVAALTPDVERGEWVFYAGGCASCHSAKGAEGDDKLVLSGGKAFQTQFGTFYAPNISPEKTHGIGNWSALDLLNAMRHGVSPDGQHYFPAFPYTSYARVQASDVVSLHAYMMTLPTDATPSLAHDVGFPFNIRRSLGGWKLLFMNADWHLEGDHSEEILRGRYLVEGLGHCTECHTARNALGGLDRAKWLMGAALPVGPGKVPGIDPSTLDWSAEDIAEYLSSGFTPEYDVAGGEMTEVIENTSKLSDADRAAIAAYIKALP